MFQTANPAVTTTPAALKTFVTATGVVTSITNSDGTLTISPTSGAAVASLALGHANTWTGIQTFSTANGIVYSGATTGTQVACLGLDASNNVIKSAAACGSGGGGTPAGPSSAVQYNNSSAFGGDASFEFVAPGKVTIAGGSIAANAAALTITQTWNNAATTFDAPLFMNITSTAAGASSFLVDLQKGGSTQLGLTRDGLLWIQGNNAYGAIAPGAPNTGIQFGGSGLASGATSAYIWEDEITTGFVAFTAKGQWSPTSQAPMALSGTFLNFGNAASLGWTSTTSAIGSSASPDTALFRDAAISVLALANKNAPTVATGFRVYNTTDHVGDGTAPTNYERGVFDWTTTAGTLTIGTQKGGTGSGRPIAFVTSSRNSPSAGDFSFLPASGGTWALVLNDLILSIPSNSTLGFTSSNNGAAPSSVLDTALGRVAAALMEVNNGTAAGVAFMRLNGVVVASLPACSATYQGARGTVTNASQTFTAGIGAVVAGGGANIVPVFCDGTNWRIG
jgi:hypothetical protein